MFFSWEIIIVPVSLSSPLPHRGSVPASFHLGKFLHLLQCPEFNRCRAASAIIFGLSFSTMHLHVRDIRQGMNRYCNADSSSNMLCLQVGAVFLQWHARNAFTAWDVKCDSPNNLCELGMQWIFQPISNYSQHSMADTNKKKNNYVYDLSSLNHNGSFHGKK